MKHDEKADMYEAGQSVSTASADDFDGLILRGGVANHDTLRTCEESVDFVRDFFKQRKPVAAICHSPWILIEADVVRGRKVTSWPSLKTDLKDAGAEWVDEECVRDRGPVTSRDPNDLAAFSVTIIEEFAEGKNVNKPLKSRREAMRVNS